MLKKNFKPLPRVLTRKYVSKPFLVYRKNDQRPPNTIDNAAYKSYVSKVRQEIRKNYLADKDRRDDASVQKFSAFRDKVVAYRLKKREVSVNNIKRHEQVQAAILEEKERQRRERNQRRINYEILKSQQRIYHLKKMVKESVNYVTEETLDLILNKQLNRTRVVTPTIFSDRIGILDEAEHQRLVVAGEKLNNPFPHHSPIMPKLSEFFDVNLIQYDKVTMDKEADVEWIPEGPHRYQTLETDDTDIEK